MLQCLSKELIEWEYLTLAWHAAVTLLLEGHNILCVIKLRGSVSTHKDTKVDRGSGEKRETSCESSERLQHEGNSIDQATGF